MFARAHVSVRLSRHLSASDVLGRVGDAGGDIAKKISAKFRACRSRTVCKTGGIRHRSTGYHYYDLIAHHYAIGEDVSFIGERM